jgi:O-antigen ligase
MVITEEKIAKIRDYLLLLFFIVFPFGQLLKFSILIGERPVNIHAIDIVVGLSALTLFLNGRYKRINKNYFSFFIIAIFALVLSFNQFTIIQITAGSLYLIRFLAYFLFLFFVYFYSERNKKKKDTLYKSLVIISAISALFGWIQYIWYPDLRFLKYLGWDEHLFRLAGTFLDPIFTGLIIVFGFILSIHLYRVQRKLLYLLISVFLMVSLALTYSRASYVALVVALFTYFPLKKIKLLLTAIVVFGAALLLLPRPEGEGIKLERVQSIRARWAGYKETAMFYSKNPVFGVGFNNMCSLRENYYENSSLQSRSHACGGTDLGILLILTTTGVVGLILFIYTIVLLSKRMTDNRYKRVLLSVGSALFIHSFFANSLFYPWIMGYFFILVAITMNDTKEYK